MKKLLSFMFIASLFLVSCEVEQFDGQELTSVNGKAKTNHLNTDDDSWSEDGKCETAFGRFCDCQNLNKCFSDFGINRWGWSVELNDNYGTKTYGFYAGAGQCDLGKSTPVGNVKVTFNHDGTVTPGEVNVKPGFTLTEFHFYAGDTPTPIHKNGKPTVAPGQFYNEGDSDGDGTVYVILHAVVCGDFE